MLRVRGILVRAGLGHVRYGRDLQDDGPSELGLFRIQQRFIQNLGADFPDVHLRAVWAD